MIDSVQTIGLYVGADHRSTRIGLAFGETEFR